MNLNKAMLIGNVTKDPEMRTTPNGQSVTSFSIATNSQWTDASGQRQERAEFHNLVAWGKLAETCTKYLKRGSKIYAEGRLQTRSWDDPQGTGKKYRTEIVLETMIMLDRATQSSDQGVPQEPQQSAPPDEGPADEIRVEDIPF